MSNRITLDELQSYLWNSAVLLRTNIDAGSYKQYIFITKLYSYTKKISPHFCLFLTKRGCV